MSTYERSRATHQVVDGKIKCRQTSFYPLKVSEKVEEVTCQYCLNGPKVCGRKKDQRK